MTLSVAFIANICCYHMSQLSALSGMPVACDIISSGHHQLPQNGKQDRRGWLSNGLLSARARDCQRILVPMPDDQQYPTESKARRSVSAHDFPVEACLVAFIPENKTLLGTDGGGGGSFLPLNSVSPLA